MEKRESKQNRRITARKIARENGSRTYIGKICGNHLAGVRYVATKKCVECNRETGQRHRSAGFRSTPYTKKWRANNRSRAREHCNNWAAKNRAQVNAASLAYHYAHPEVARRAARNRRARLLKAEGFHTQADIERIFRQQRKRCAYCQTKLTIDRCHVDHIQPLTKDGSNWPKNLQILCPTCNRTKNNQDPIAFARVRGMLL